MAAYETYRTPDGTTGPVPKVDSLTVAGLIEALQEHVAIDPERAHYPVAIWPLGPGPARYVPVLAVASGNNDPKVGGHLQVALMALRAPNKW